MTLVIFCSRKQLLLLLASAEMKSPCFRNSGCGPPSQVSFASELDSGFGTTALRMSWSLLAAHSLGFLHSSPCYSFCHWKVSSFLWWPSCVLWRLSNNLLSETRHKWLCAYPEETRSIIWWSAGPFTQTVATRCSLIPFKEGKTIKVQGSSLVSQS